VAAQPLTLYQADLRVRFFLGDRMAGGLILFIQGNERASAKRDDITDIQP
jgi:hypothetical protein